MWLTSINWEVTHAPKRNEKNTTKSIKHTDSERKREKKWLNFASRYSNRFQWNLIRRKFPSCVWNGTVKCLHSGSWAREVKSLTSFFSLSAKEAPQTTNATHASYFILQIFFFYIHLRFMRKRKLLTVEKQPSEILCNELCRKFGVLLA